MSQMLDLHQLENCGHLAVAAILKGLDSENNQIDVHLISSFRVSFLNQSSGSTEYTVLLK